MRNKIEKRFIRIIYLAVIASFPLVSLSLRGINGNVDHSSPSFPNLSAQDTFWPSSSSDWIEVAPEEQGLDSAKISEMFEYIASNSYYDIHSVIIVRNGYLLTEKYLNNFQLLGTKSYFSGSTIHAQYSATKSLMSILIGIALQEGFLDNLNQTLYEFFADIWEPSFTNSTLKKSITIEQILTMRAGFAGSDSISYPPDAGTLVGADCIKFTLEDLPLTYTPGKVGGFAYTNDGPNLLSGIIANVTGKSAEEFAKEYLFAPLGISEDEYNWRFDGRGISYGGYGFECSPKVQAKLGILSLKFGTWNGTQIVDSNYIKNATASKTMIYSAEKDTMGDFGYLFWMMDGLYDGYYSFGGGGQSIFVIPEYNITVGFTGSNGMPEFYEQMISDYIIQFVDPDPIPYDPILIIVVSIIITGLVGISIVLFVFRKRRRALLDERKVKIIQEYQASNVQITEEEVAISEEKKICLVCKSKVLRFSYICECGANYCGNCAQALINLENACWACEEPIDFSRPVKKLKGKAEDVKVDEKAKKDVKK